MVTGYPQVLVGPQTATDAAGAREVASGLATRAFRRVGQMLCGLSGHDLVRHYEQNRVALVCASCGHVSPGWELTAPMPHQRYAGDPGRHQLHREPQALHARGALTSTKSVVPGPRQTRPMQGPMQAPPVVSSRRVA
jgi:hypothetical protein